jgi:hypothetical protein
MSEFVMAENGGITLTDGEAIDDVAGRGPFRTMQVVSEAVIADFVDIGQSASDSAKWETTIAPGVYNFQGITTCDVTSGLVYLIK